MLSLYEILKASKTGIAPDMWTALAGMNWGGADSGHEIKELTGIPPLSFIADGTPLLDYLISGNMVQTGTPTPQNPIQPQECGERTGNLCGLNPYKIGYAISNSGTEIQNSEFNIYTAKVSAGTQYCLSFIYPESARSRMVRIHEYSGGIWQNQLIAQNCVAFPLSFTTSDNIDEVRISIINTTSNHMLNLGSTALPYEPYGYKIPILNNSQTTNVYLGEVQSTRNIKKLVLTGEEDWTNNSNNACCVMLLSDIGSFTRYNPLILCNYVPTAYQQGDLYERTVDYGIAFGANAADRICIRNKDCELVTDFKQWLAQQYVNGTPVTVWYVLATETTGILNEPLRKIGSYADTLSKEQAGVQIPTNRDNTVIDVETALKPSQLYIKYQE